MPTRPIAASLLSPLSVLLSQRCAACRQPGPALCRSCRFALASGRTVELEGARAAMPFDGTARSAILGLKYGNRRPVAAYLARLMVRRLDLSPASLAAPRFDVVTWAPTSPERQRARGFDQAELLAREVARQIGVPCRRLLHRSHGAPQTGRPRAERLVDGPTFRARGQRGLRVLVVDDVITTGGTLAAAGRALADAGVAHVSLAAVAATPRPASVVSISVAARRFPARRAPTFSVGAGHGSLARLEEGSPVGSIPA